MILTSGHHYQVLGCPHRGALEPLIGCYSDFGKTSYCLPKEMGDGVLTGNMSTSGLKKVVPNDYTDIWTLSPGIRMPPILQGSNKRDGRQGQS